METDRRHLLLFNHGGGGRSTGSYILCTMLRRQSSLSVARENNRWDVASPELSANASLSTLQLRFRHPELDYRGRQDAVKITRSVLPDVNHFGLVSHDRRISPDWIYSRDDKLDRGWLVRDLKRTEKNLPFHHIRA